MVLKSMYHRKHVLSPPTSTPSFFLYPCYVMLCTANAKQTSFFSLSFITSILNLFIKNSYHNKDSLLHFQKQFYLHSQTHPSPKNSPFLQSHRLSLRSIVYLSLNSENFIPLWKRNLCFHISAPERSPWHCHRYVPCQSTRTWFFQ